MGLKNTDKFILESIELLTNIKKDTESASAYLHRISLNDYVVKFEAASKVFSNIKKKIDEFNDKWETDNYKVCSTLYKINSHLEYYIRMCDNSSPSNYMTNGNYMSDSSSTLALLADTRIKALMTNKDEEDFVRRKEMLTFAK